MISALWARYEVEKKVYGVSSAAVYNEVKRRVLRPIPSEPKWQVAITQYHIDKVKDPKRVRKDDDKQTDKLRPRLLDGRSTLSREMLIAHCQKHLAANLVFLADTTQKRDKFVSDYSENW
jgi:Mg-chelatase subunit ChlI